MTKHDDAYTHHYDAAALAFAVEAVGCLSSGSSHDRSPL
jgi:hypothetical protein